MPASDFYRREVPPMLQSSRHDRYTRPDFDQASLLAGAVAVPGEFGAGAAGCRLARVAGALWRGGRFGLILPSLEGGGWEHERGLPVTPSARGTRARMF